MAAALYTRVKKSLKGKRNAVAKTGAPLNDGELEQHTLDPAFDKQLQGKSDQSVHNSKEPTNVPHAGVSHSKIAHSIDHPGSPDSASVSPCTGIQSMNTTDKKSTPNQQEALAPYLGPSTVSQAFPNPEQGNKKGYEHIPSDALNGKKHSAVPASKSKPHRPVNSSVDRPRESDNSLSARVQEPSAVTVCADAVHATNTCTSIGQSTNTCTSIGQSTNTCTSIGQSTNTCTSIGQSGNPLNSTASSNATPQASTAAAAISALTDQPLNQVNSEISVDDVQPAKTSPLPDIQQSPAGNSAAAAPSDGETVVSESGDSRSTEQQQSLTGLPTQVEQEPTGGEDTIITSGEETPQQGQTINYQSFFVSEKICGNKFLQDKLAVRLDRTAHRVIKSWEHLACTEEINAPLKVRLKCKMAMAGENSCTLMLFDILTSELDITVGDVVNALTKIKRNDVKKIITDVYPSASESTEKFSDFVASLANSNLIEAMATGLDQKSAVNRYWLHLGQQFKLPNERLKEIEYGPFNPTKVLIEYLYSKKTDLTIGVFYEEVKKLKRNDVLKKLDAVIVAKGARDKPMKEVIELESDTMRSICVCLNNPSTAIKNWKNLCKSPALGIPEDVYKDCEAGKHKSPTDLLFEWIFASTTNLTVGQLCCALKKIDRNDIVRDLREHFEQNTSCQLGQN